MRTGAIISEVEHEIKILNDETYQRHLHWLLTLEDLIEKMGFVRDEENPACVVGGDEQPYDGTSHQMMSMDQIRDSWLHERALIRRKLKESFNPFFGSVCFNFLP